MKVLIKGHEYQCEFIDRPIKTGDYVGVIPTKNNITGFVNYRFVTDANRPTHGSLTKGKYFYDDGLISGQEPCASCNKRDYKPLNIEWDYVKMRQYK